VNFIIDAQLPRRTATWLRARGHDALHTLDLPDANRTTDASILELAARENRVVVTKDADFVDSFMVRREPEKLLLISTGNITNADLERILVPNVSTIVAALDVADFVEVNQTGVIVHG
jgi:predicted nuclease of predicted toxin-antitoxin system